MADAKTLIAYDALVDDYANLVCEQPIDPTLTAFIDRLKVDDYVLDLGCGPAQASATMREHGLRVDPVDASSEMVKLANSKYNIGARLATFDDIQVNAVYDAIWANFSLLHAGADELPDILSALHRALKPRGLFHIAMKTGGGTMRDNLDRLYSYYTHEQLHDYLTQAGFNVGDSVHGEAKGLAGGVEPWMAVSCYAR